MKANALLSTLLLLAWFHLPVHAQDGCFEDVNRDSRIDGNDYLQVLAKIYTNCTVFKPAVNTSAVTGITDTSAILAGFVTSEGGSLILFSGACWSQQANPTVVNSKSYAPVSDGVIRGEVRGLQPATLYHARAYATNGVGTSYGQEVSFTTLARVPVVETTSITEITKNSATSGGRVSSDGGSPVLQKGICWGTLPGPLITNNHTENGADTGRFDSQIAGLTPGTLYYVRAYATNVRGTAYGQQVSFYTTFLGLVVIDADSNVYQVDTIGTQIWMAENLRTTKYNDGLGIPLITDQQAWGVRTAPAFCWYNNDPVTYKQPYGAIYKYYTVNTGKLCPGGWHVPTLAEWTVLADYLGGMAAAGGKLKESGTDHWLTPNTGANNQSDFTARPGGYRRFNGVFTDIRISGYWWSTTEAIVDHAYDMQLQFDTSGVIQDYSHKRCGFSIRCLKD